MEYTERDRQESFIQAIFKTELLSLCGQAIHARAQLEEALQDRSSPTRAWLAIHGVLVIAANASKLIWGKGASRAREMLRLQARVFHDSPLKSKAVRNAFEHVDERIVKWARGSGTHYVERWIIWDGERYPGGSQFGTFDAQTWTVDFLDEEPMSLTALLDELDRIRARLHPFASQET